MRASTHVEKEKIRKNSPSFAERNELSENKDEYSKRRQNQDSSNTRTKDRTNTRTRPMNSQNFLENFGQDPVTIRRETTKIEKRRNTKGNVKDDLEMKMMTNI